MLKHFVKKAVQFKPSFTVMCVTKPLTENDPEIKADKDPRDNNRHIDGLQISKLMRTFDPMQVISDSHL